MSRMQIHNTIGQPARHEFSFIGLSLILTCRCTVSDGYTLSQYLEVEGRPGYIDLSGRPANPFEDQSKITRGDTDLLREMAAEFGRPLIVTRHAGLVEVFREDYGLSAELLAHATPDQVRGRVTVGVLPMHLAALSLVHVEITLNFTRADQRQRELSADEVRAIMGPPRLYAVDGV